jgi:hypothetical protein
MATAAMTAAKVASLGGLTAYGVRTLLFRPLPEPIGPVPRSAEGTHHEPTTEKAEA